MAIQETGEIFDIPPLNRATISSRTDATVIRNKAKNIGGTVLTEFFVTAKELPQMFITAVSNIIDET